MNKLFSLGKRCYLLSEKISNVVFESEARLLIILFVTSFLIKAIFAYFIYDGIESYAEKDSLTYLYLGEQIAKGNWSANYATGQPMSVAPVAPVMIALFILLFNNPFVPYIIHNIIVTSLFVPVLYFLGKKLFNRKVGLVLSVWGLFYYQAYRYLINTDKESILLLFVPLTILLLLNSVQASKQRSWFYTLLASLSFSWLIHTDERFFVYIVILPAIYFLKRPINRVFITKHLVLWFFAIFLFMLPWNIRNYKVHDQVVLLSLRTTSFTGYLWGAKHPMFFSEDDARDRFINRFMPQVEQFKNKYNVEPREYGKAEAKLKAFVHFWQPAFFNLNYIQLGFRPQIWSLGHNVMSLLFYGIFLPFYLIGIMITIRKRNWIALLIAAIPIIHSLIHAYMVWPLARYRSPVVFIVVMMGIYAIHYMLRILKERLNFAHSSNISIPTGGNFQ